jgi:PAS domain S-box-containing protein
MKLQKIRLLSQQASLVTALIGCIVIIGWIFHLELLTSIFPGLPPMRVNAALGFILSGSSLWFWHKVNQETTSYRKFKRSLSYAFAIVVACIALLTLIQFLFKTNLGIDELLLKDFTSQIGYDYPGRIAMLAALKFLILSVALILLNRGIYNLAQALAFGSFLISLLGLAGYSYQVQYFYTLFSGGSAALGTVIAFCILSLSILFAHPEQGWIKVITSPYSGGIIARSLLPLVIGLPLILGGSIILTQRNNLMPIEVSIISRSILNILILTSVTWWNARFLNKLDLKQRQTELALRKSQEQLENRVAERTAELTNANNQLQESYQLLQSVIEGISDPVFVKNRSGHYVLVNSAMNRKFGKSIDEILGLKDDDLFSPETARKLQETDEQIIELGETQEIEEEILENETEKTFLSTKSPWRDKDGNIIGLIGVIKNISDRKQTEATLKYREWLMRFFLEHTPIPAAVFDTQMRYLIVSQSWLKDYQLKNENIIGRSHYEVFPQIPQRWKETHQRCLAGRVEICEEDQFIHANGTIDWLRWEARPWYDETGAIGGIILFTEIITARKEAEFALKQSEQRYANLTSVIPVGVYCTDIHGYCNYVNQRWCELSGLSAAEGMGKGWEKALHPEDRDRIPTTWQETISQQSIFCTEYRYQRPDGSIKWVYGQAVAERAANGDITGYIGTVTDISDRKRAETDLLANEEQLRLTLEFTQIGSWDWHLLENRVTWNSNHFRLIGLDPNTAEASYQTWRDLVHPDDIEQVEARVNYALEKHTDYQAEHRVIYPDGSIHWVIGKGRAIYDRSEQPVRMLGVIMDITDRKLAEVALQTNEEKLRLAVEFAQLGSWDWHLVENYIIWNKNHFQLMGLDPETTEVNYETWRDRVHPDDLERVEAAIEQTITNHKDYDTEYRVILPDSSIHWIIAKGQAIYDQFGQPLRMLGVIMDITEHKQTEAALRHSEERWQLAVAGSQDGIWDSNLEIFEMYVSPRCLEMTGYTYAEASYEQWMSYIHPEDYPQLMAIFQAHLNKELEHYSCEHRLRCKDGNYKWFLVRGQAFWDETGKPVRAAGSLTDISDRKQAQIALEESEERFRRAIVDAPLPIILHAEDGAVIKVNHAWTEISGYSAQEIPTIADWIKKAFKSEQESVQANINRLYHLKHRVSEGENTILTPSGETRIWDFYSAPLGKLPDGRSLVISTAIDITERKRAESALQESEERLRLALNAANQGLYDLNLQTGDAIISAKYTQMLGYELAEFQETNAKWLERLHPEDRETVGQTFADYVAGNRDDYRVEFRQRTKTGDWKWILSVGKIVEWDESGKPIRMLGTHTDISERKLAEAALLASEKQLRTILENMPVMLDAVDPEGNIIIWNQECERVTGYSSEEIIGNPQAWEMCYPDPIYREEMMMKWVKVGHNYRNWEWDLVCKNGERKTISWSNISELFPVPGWSGWGIGIDITERKQAELEVIQLNQNLEQRVKERTVELAAANKELEAFSYSVSHDLRAPLRGIDGFSKVLLERYNELFDDKGKHYLNRIRAGTQRMGELIEDMLMLSRVTRAEMKRSPVNLSAIAQEISQNLGEYQPERSVEWQISPDVTTLGDAALLRIVLENLLGNAWKFTSNCDRAQIEFGTTLVSEHTQAYFVRDNGVGFDMAYANKLFIAFQRLHSNDDFPGTGVGLAIVQRIIHRHGGEVWAEGTIDQGAVFYFTLKVN